MFSLPHRPLPELRSDTRPTGGKSASSWLTRALALLAMISALAVIALAARTYHSVVLMKSAQALGAPAIGSIRPWMTLGYVSETYRVAQDELVTRLGLPENEEPRSTLRSIALRQGRNPIGYVQQVQRVLVTVLGPERARSAGSGASRTNTLAGEALSAFLVYGYPVLGIILLLSAMGVPLPAGLATIVAGSLAASGRLDWAMTAIVALGACVAGDLAGYGLGRVIDPQALVRRGAWMGYSATQHARVQAILNRWGGMAVLLTRTLGASLSGPLNVVAGAARYRLRNFAAQALTGRFVWAGAYLAIGFVAGPDLEAAASFLLSFSLLLVALAVFTGSSLAAARRGKASIGAQIEGDQR